MTKLICRNTSTDVEKTPTPDGGVHLGWKHLHGRGEDNALLTRYSEL